ncbi:N-terminal nucleophile aminohydrolase [Neolentinus lepideus HHB14362 ss-1]|uniref:N-terminal nucleophile aminohydrolase n=1 Tax=Neolentinus lepideus HHB14362 ss-1 TaxID=1314782 RepID=A0A165SDL1_9AGAM|nr:N-terminal nucleophile aminohydrolase [Neolentinus lepideus HHB14362 ss-1]
MCRWFAYISNTEPTLLEDVLIEPAHSLSKQVHEHYLPGLTHSEPDSDRKATEAEITMRNRMFNADGLGMAWYSTTRFEFDECDGPRPTIYKVLAQPTTDPVFTSICANTASTTLFAHIRAASPGSPIHIYNAHPFIFGRYTFMHNGGVTGFDYIKREVLAEMSGDAVLGIHGSSDSEHVAALFFTYLAESRGADVWNRSHPLTEMKLALEKAVQKIIDIQKEVLPKKGQVYGASSLNIAITDGEQLLTIRFRNSPTEHPPSLYLSTTAGVTLNRKYPGHPNKEVDDAANKRSAQDHGDHVIVASEPTTYQKHQWKLIEKNECIMVGTDMVVKREPVNVNF